jgi:diguanylate cyclase (GGDEF)-like protein
MVVDVDDFKRVNDTYGHPAGDEVLASIGRILTTVARVHDVPARLGGDEFALLLPGTSLGDAETLAQRLRHDVRTAGRGRGIGVSTGVASVTRGGAAELVEAADRASTSPSGPGGNLVTAPRGGPRPPSRRPATCPSAHPHGSRRDVVAAPAPGVSPGPALRRHPCGGRARRPAGQPAAAPFEPSASLRSRSASLRLSSGPSFLISFSMARVLTTWFQ